MLIKSLLDAVHVIIHLIWSSNPYWVCILSLFLFPKVRSVQEGSNASLWPWEGTSGAQLVFYLPCLSGISVGFHDDFCLTSHWGTALASPTDVWALLPWFWLHLSSLNLSILVPVNSSIQRLVLSWYTLGGHQTPAGHIPPEPPGIRDL